MSRYPGSLDIPIPGSFPGFSTYFQKSTTAIYDKEKEMPIYSAMLEIFTFAMTKDHVRFVKLL